MKQATKYILTIFAVIFMAFSSYGQDSIIIDTYVKGNLNMQLFRYDNDLCYKIHKSDYNNTINLDKQNIVWKPFPTIIWTNDLYACVMTYWTGPLSYHLFLPLDEKVELQYITKDIEQTDSLNNNICFVDSLTDNNAIFTVQNLITKKKKSIFVKINEQNGIYPYYETIILTKNTAIIKTTIETLVIDIKEINNGT